MNNLGYVILSKSKEMPEGGCDKWHIFGEASDPAGAFAVAMRAKDANGNYGVYKAVELRVTDQKEQVSETEAKELFEIVVEAATKTALKVSDI